MYQHDRFRLIDRQTTKTATETGTTAPTKHAFHTDYCTSPKSLPGEKNHQPVRYRDECMPLVSSMDTVYYYDLRVAQLSNRNDLCHCLLCGKAIPCFFSHVTSQTKSWVYNRATVCVLLRAPILLARVQTTWYVCQCARIRIIPPSRPGMQPLVMLLCVFFWRSNHNHSLCVLVMPALATSIHVRTYLPKFNK